MYPDLAASTSISQIYRIILATKHLATSDRICRSMPTSVEDCRSLPTSADMYFYHPVFLWLILRNHTKEKPRLVNQFENDTTTLIPIRISGRKLYSGVNRIFTYKTIHTYLHTNICLHTCIHKHT